MDVCVGIKPLFERAIVGSNVGAYVGPPMRMDARVGEEMAFGRDPANAGNGIPALITRLADGLGKLVTEHITLARLELAEDAKSVGGNVARIAAFVPFVIVGYAFLCGALAVLLAPLLTLAGSLALVGFLNAAGGGYGLYRAAQRLKATKVMDESVKEIAQSAQILTASAQSNGKNTVKELSRGE